MIAWNHEIFSRNSKSYDDEKAEGMFQINDIDVFRGYESGRSAYDAIWEHARREAVENGHSEDPIQVGFIGFMNPKCPGGSVMPIRISSQAREFAKLAPPFGRECEMTQMLLRAVTCRDASQWCPDLAIL